jgi:hypothetical protein
MDDWPLPVLVAGYINRSDVCGVVVGHKAISNGIVKKVQRVWTGVLNFSPVLLVVQQIRFDDNIYCRSLRSWRVGAKYASVDAVRNLHICAPQFGVVGSPVCTGLPIYSIHYVPPPVKTRPVLDGFRDCSRKLKKI